MPILGAGAALDPRPARILVAGTSGSGKTAVAGRVAQALGAPHTEIDALFHGPSCGRATSSRRDVRHWLEGPLAAATRP